MKRFTMDGIQPTKPTEHQECVAFYDWAIHNHLVRDYIIHIPNEGRRTFNSGRKLKLIGLRAGVPDYFIAIPNGKHHGLFLEMKRQGLEKQAKRENQLAWIERLIENGYYACMAYGADQAIAVVNDYLAGKI